MSTIETFVSRELGMLDKQQINPNEPTLVSPMYINEDEIDYPDKVYTNLSNSSQINTEYNEAYLDFSKTNIDNNVENPETTNSFAKDPIAEVVNKDSKYEEQPKLYTCNACPTFYSRMNNLIQHYKQCHTAEQNSVEPEKKTEGFACELCSKIFYSNSKLKIHHRAVHLIQLKENYHCHICEQGFKSRIVLLNHVKNIHNMTVLNYFNLKNANYKPRVTSEVNESTIKKKRETKTISSKRCRKPKQFENFIVKEMKFHEQIKKYSQIKDKKKKMQSTNIKRLVGDKPKRGRPRKYISDDSKPKENKTYHCEKVAKLVLRRIDEQIPWNKIIAKEVNMINKSSNNLKTLGNTGKLIENEASLIRVEDNARVTKRRIKLTPKITEVTNRMRVFIPRRNEINLSSTKISDVKTNAKATECNSKATSPRKKLKRPFKSTSTSLRHSRRKIKPIQMSGFIYTLAKRKRRVSSAVEENDTSLEETFVQDFSTKVSITESKTNEKDLSSFSKQGPNERKNKFQKLEEKESDHCAKIIINRVRKPKILPDFVYDDIATPISTNTKAAGSLKLKEINCNVTKKAYLKKLKNGKVEREKNDVQLKVKKPKDVQFEAPNNEIKCITPSPTKMPERSKLIAFSSPTANTSSSAQNVKRIGSNLRTDENLFESSSKIEAEKETTNTEISKLEQAEIQSIIPDTRRVVDDITSSYDAPLSLDMGELMSIISLPKSDTSEHDGSLKPTITTINFKESKDLYKEVSYLLAQKPPPSVSMPQEVSRGSTENPLENIIIPAPKVFIGFDGQSKLNLVEPNLFDVTRNKNLCVSKKTNVIEEKQTSPKNSAHILNTTKKRGRPPKIRPRSTILVNLPTEIVKTRSINPTPATSTSKNSSNPKRVSPQPKSIMRVAKTNHCRPTSMVRFKGLSLNKKTIATKPEFARKSSPYPYTFYYDKKIVKPMSIVIDKLKENIFRQIVEKNL